MIFGEKTLFSDNQAITVTAVSDNALQFDVADIGQGKPVYLVVQATEDFAYTVEATLTIALQDKSTGSFADVATRGPIALADLKAGKELWRMVLPDGLDEDLQLNYTVTGGPFTAGKVVAALTM
jgi:hypothetical protein